MRFIPETDSAKDAYALWSNAISENRSNVADINLNVFEDMKRFYIFDLKTGQMTTPFYTEEMQKAYDPVHNPQPHMTVLKQNFNMEYLENHDIYVYANGADMPKKLKYTEGKFVTAELSEIEKKSFTKYQNKKHAEAKMQNARSILESTLDFADSAMDTYKTFYGKNRPDPESLRKRKHCSYEEKIMFGFKRQVDVSKDKEIQSNLSDEEFALLTIAAHFTADVSKAGENKEGMQIKSMSFYLDTIACYRSGYDEYGINNKAHEMVREAAADMQEGNPNKMGKLLAEGLNTFAAAQRDFKFATGDGALYLNKTTIADTIVAVRMLELFKSRPELLKTAKENGLKEESLVIMKAAANAYKLEVENMHTVDEMMQSENKDLTLAKENLTKILTDQIMLHSFSEQINKLETDMFESAEFGMDLAAAEREARKHSKGKTQREKQKELAEENNKVYAKYYARKLQIPPLNIEKNFSDVDKIDYMRKELQKQTYVQNRIRKIADSCITYEDVIHVLTQPDLLQLSVPDKEKIKQLTNLEVKELKHSVPEENKIAGQKEENINTDLVRKPEEKQEEIINTDSVKDQENAAEGDNVQEYLPANEVAAEYIHKEENEQPGNPPAEDHAEAPGALDSIDIRKAYLKELMKLNKALKHTDPIVGKSGTNAYTNLQSALERNINVLQVPEHMTVVAMRNSLHEIAEKCEIYMNEHEKTPNLSNRQQNRLKFMNRLMDLKDYFDEERNLKKATDDTCRQIIAAKIVQSKAKYYQTHRVDHGSKISSRSYESDGRMLQTNRKTQKNALETMVYKDSVFAFMTRNSDELKHMAAKPGADLLKEYAKLKKLEGEIYEHGHPYVRKNDDSSAREKKEIKRLAECIGAV